MPWGRQAKADAADGTPTVLSSAWREELTRFIRDRVWQTRSQFKVALVENLGGLSMGYYSHYTVAVPKSQPFSIRLGEDADLLVADEVRRSGRSRSAVVEELTEEAAKTRLFPGIAFRGSPRRAWVIGSGLDVWEILELLRSYTGDEQQLRAAHPMVDERHLRLARAYGERFPDEIAAFRDQAGRSLDELRRLYPFLHASE